MVFRVPYSSLSSQYTSSVNNSDTTWVYLYFRFYIFKLYNQCPPCDFQPSKPKKQSSKKKIIISSIRDRRKRPTAVIPSNLSNNSRGKSNNRKNKLIIATSPYRDSREISSLCQLLSKLKKHSPPCSELNSKTSDRIHKQAIRELCNSTKNAFCFKNKVRR